MRIRSLALLGLAALLPYESAAQSLAWSGQIRPRTEWRDPMPGGEASAFTSMRTRLTLEARPDEGVTLVFQPQDVRTWGVETHPLFDFAADALDLHQGYVRLDGVVAPWLTATVGRMETNFGGQRLVGAVGWTPQGQSFDGIRLDARGQRVTSTLVAWQINDSDAPGISTDRNLTGIYNTISEVGSGSLDLYWLWDRVRQTTTSDEHLFGARYAFDGAVQGRVEATRASGSRGGLDVRAYMVGARVGTELVEDLLNGTLWFDLLSGDDPSTPQTEVFNTFFGTNHKFYGLADVFLNLPAHTAGAGLRDAAMKFRIRAADRTSVNVELHAFRVGRQGVLNESRFGEEIDAFLTHRYSDHVTLTFGTSRVFAGPALAEAGRLFADLSWAYVMLDAAF